MGYLKKHLRLFAFLCGAFTSSVSAGDFDNVNIKTTDLGHGIYMLVGGGGNIGVSVGDDGVFMIDDQFAGLSPKIKTAIKQLSQKPIKYLVNTHWHYDHTGGNENFAKDGVLIVAHKNVRERMSKDGFIKAFNKKIPAAPKVAQPVMTFNDGLSFHVNALDIEIMHVSHAHTDGDSIVLFKSANVIHMGDTFFNGLYPFIDASSGGSVNGMIKAVNYALSIADDKTKIIPGHGPLGDKKSLLVFRDMLISVRDNVQALKDQGKTLEQILALKPNAKQDKVWGKGFLSPELFLKTLYSAMP